MILDTVTPCSHSEKTQKALEVKLTEQSKLAVSADKNPPLPSANTTANPPSKELYSMARKLTPSVFKGIAWRYKKNQQYTKCTKRVLLKKENDKR